MGWSKKPLKSSVWPTLAQNPLPFAGLLTSLPEEYDYFCDVEGQLDGIHGTLYRVGPGLYDRGPDRKRMMLDGDGMVQALQFRGGKVRFRNRFVRTAKYIEETAANRFVYPTFSCHGSGPLHKNLGLSLPNQANTTVLAWADKIWAFDEGQQPYTLDHQLETLGQVPLDPENPGLAYWAHWKLDASRQQVHCLSISQGRTANATINSLSTDGHVVTRRSIELPRSVYIHDWFVTENYFAFLLHPAYIDFGKMLRVLIGRETFSEAIQWRPERGGVLVVAERAGDKVWQIESPACWMWHAINAYEDRDRLMLDFIGAELGGGLGNAESPLFQIMRGVLPETLGHATNFLRRWEVDPPGNSMTEHIIDRSANYELPGLSATERTRPYSSAFMVRSAAGELFPTGLCRLDGRDLSTEHYEFGAEEYCGEPVVLDGVAGQRGQYLATQVYCGSSKRSHLAIFHTNELSAGPIARIYLRHHVPVSFHGYWHAFGLGPL